MIGGLPLSNVYSVRAVRRAPERFSAWTGLAFSLLALAGLASAMLYWGDRSVTAAAAGRMVRFPGG
ncbi:MAG TPA: hypothetical protein VGK61_04730 [Planctomycetota bacterium]|jgi:hypothetical protein